MTAAYDVTRWESFAGAGVGTAAALARLLVVASSINLGRILTMLRGLGISRGACLGRHMR
jgi:hypothetical protein